MAHAQDLFEQADVNGDGVLCVTELRDVLLRGFGKDRIAARKEREAEAALMEEEDAEAHDPLGLFSGEDVEEDLGPEAESAVIDLGPEAEDAVNDAGIFADDARLVLEQPD